MRHTAYICLLTLSAPPIPAQEVRRGAWSQVATLIPGQGIEAQPFNGKQVRGQFRSATPETLSIDVKSGPITMNRSDIKIVKLRRGSGRFRNAGIGAAIGGGIAAGISTAALHRDLDDELAVAIILVITTIGAAVGFAVGLVPAAYNTIYEAQRP